MQPDPTARRSHPFLLRVSSASDQILQAVELVTLVLACISLFAIMALIFVDGSSRYLFNRPLQFASDVVTLYLTSAAFLLVLSYSLRHGIHISVDLFSQSVNSRLRNTLIGLSMLCAVPVVAVMAYQVAFVTLDSWRQGEALVGMYALPVWPSKAIVAFGIAVFNIRLLHLGLANFLAGLTGNETIAFPMTPIETHPEEEMV